MGTRSPRNPTQPTKSRARPSPTSSLSRSCVRSSRSSSRTSTPTSSSRTAETKSPSPPSSLRSAKESSPPPSTTAPWQEEGSEAKKAMDQVTNEIVPFMVSYQAKQPFHKPNDVQDAACMKVVAGRLCEEAFYEWATKNDSKSISSDPEKQAKQAASIAKTVTDAVVGLLNKEVLPQSAE